MIIIELKKLLAIFLVLIAAALLIRAYWDWQLVPQPIVQTRMQDVTQSLKGLMVDMSPFALFLILLVAVLIWHHPTESIGD